MTQCKKCGARVAGDFKSQLRHIIIFHPYHVGVVFLPLVMHDPYEVGQQFAEYTKQRLKEKLSNVEPD